MLLDKMTFKAKAIAAIFALGLVFFSGFYLNGVLWETKYSKLVIQQQEQQIERHKDFEKRMAMVNEDYKGLQGAMEDLDKKMSESNKNVEDKIKSLSANYLSGTNRLSVLVQRHIPSSVSPSNGGQDSPVDNATETADLDRQVAANLAGLVGEGDLAITQLTACQARINILEEAIALYNERNKTTSK